jgi:hypothetical protein
MLQDVMKCSYNETPTIKSQHRSNPKLQGCINFASPFFVA